MLLIFVGMYRPNITQTDVITSLRGAETIAKLKSCNHNCFCNNKHYLAMSAI